MTDCEERVLSDLHFAERSVRHGDREFRLGNRSAAKGDYKFAHEMLRRAIGRTRGCTIMRTIQDDRGVLRRLVVVADEFENLERKLEG
jgi:hypothetical protein